MLGDSYFCRRVLPIRLVTFNGYLSIPATRASKGRMSEIFHQAGADKTYVRSCGLCFRLFSVSIAVPMRRIPSSGIRTVDGRNDDGLLAGIAIAVLSAYEFQNVIVHPIYAPASGDLEA